MHRPFKIGDKVKRIGGDYAFEGVVVSVFRKRNGRRRYVVEGTHPRGFLFIFRDDNLIRNRRVR